MRSTVLFGQSACTADFFEVVYFHGFMKADLGISTKDYRRNKNFKIQLTQVPFARRASFGCG
jgi:hypothetical protein